MNFFTQIITTHVAVVYMRQQSIQTSGPISTLMDKIDSLDDTLDTMSLDA